MADGTTGSAGPGAEGARIARAAHGQELVWRTGRRSGGLLLQHVADTFRLDAAVDGEQVRSALAALTARHTALRTSVRVLDGELRQVVHPGIELPVEFTDLSGPDDGKRAERLAEIADQAAVLPFDPARAPLWRAVAVRLGEADWAVVLVAHQLVCDPASLFLLNAELAELCAAEEQGRAPVLPDRLLDFADHADRQHGRDRYERARRRGRDRRYEQGRQYDQDRPEPHADTAEFWRSRLAGRPSGHGLPLDRPRPAVRAFAGAEVRAEFPSGLAAALRAGARRLGGSPAPVLLAGYAALLHHRSGRTDHLIGVPVSGRRGPETLSLVGALAGQVVLRLDTSGDPSFAALVERVRDVASAAWQHQELSVADLQDVADPAEPSAGQPPGAPVHQLAFTLAEGELGAPCGYAEDDLLLEVADRAARLVYDTELFAPATARALLDDYLALLAAGLAEPAAPLSGLPAAAADRTPAARPAPAIGPAPATGRTPAARPAPGAGGDGRAESFPTGSPGPAGPEGPGEGRSAPSVLLRSTQ
ncbi:condensation domain-containing protein [Kitasatospora sp. NPDC056076]|uniref:condensation domain-containing protein n=1 Tax=Kitasatospora sp. NPDC056076 TaxID=3345703 RepID=UPI0035E00ACB